MKLDLTAYRGDDLQFQLNFVDVEGTAINITGWKLFFTIKPVFDDLTADSSAVVSKTVIDHVDAVNGESVINVSGLDVNALRGSYKYDFQYANSDFGIKTFLSGNIDFLPDVTRRRT